jgi:hypothetical protein
MGAAARRAGREMVKADTKRMQAAHDQPQGPLGQAEVLAQRTEGGGQGARTCTEVLFDLTHVGVKTHNDTPGNPLIANHAAGCSAGDRHARLCMINKFDGHPTVETPCLITTNQGQPLTSTKTR